MQHKTRRGSLLLEAIVAIGVFAIFLGGIGIALVLGERSTITGGDRGRATYRAEEQLVAVRQMQKNDFSSLTEGVYGLALENGAWIFSGTGATEDGFTSYVEIVETSDEELLVLSTVRWNLGTGRSGSVVLSTTLTDWQAPMIIGNWSNAALAGELTQGGSPSFQDVAVSGNYAFVASSVSPGLFVYDITTSTPVRVSSSLDIGAGAYALTVTGERLLVAGTDTTREFQVFDISDPATMTLGNRINEYDLPSTLGARSVAVYGDSAFVGMADDALNPQLHAIDISEAGSTHLLDSMSVSGSVLGISLNNGYAFLAMDTNTAELQVVDVIDPEDLQYAPGTGIDMTNTHDALAIVTSGTSALIGRTNGSTISELTMYDIGLSPVPSPPPGPWTLEIGGDAHALTTIEGTKYGFVGGTAASAQLRVIDTIALEKSGTVILKTIDVGANVQGLVYDWLSDRLLVVTGETLKVYAPGA